MPDSQLVNYLTGDYPISWHDQKALEKDAAKPLKKTAGVSSFLSTLVGAAKQGLPLAATATVAGIGAEYALRGHESIVGAVQKSRAFKRILSHSPDLKELPADKLQEQFTTLYRFSPSVAKSPQVAASWLRQINAHTIEGREFIPPETIKDLVAIEKSLSDVKSKGMARALPQAIMGGLMSRQRGGGGPAAATLYSSGLSGKTNIPS